MNEDERPINRIYPSETDCPPMKHNVPEALRIAQRVEQFINDNGWSWCLMDRVYRILKAAHQG
jgi:hypothetical protein